MIIHSAVKYNIHSHREKPFYQNRALTWKGSLKTNENQPSTPKKFQDIAKVLQKQSDGNARIEYNSATAHYEVIQTNVLGKDIQEVRTVLNDKAWQENLTKA